MELTITNTTETFENWLEKDFVDEKLRETLSKASILILPFENLRDTKNPLMFPIGTEDILRYFKEKLPDEQLIDICISDELYQEFAFYSDYKRLGNYIVKSVAVPIFVGVMYTYVYDKFIKEDNTKPQIEIIDNSTHITVNNHISTLTDKKYLEPTHIKFSVTIVDTTGSSKNISYEGPASDIDTVLKSLKEYEE
ncbi:MAG TPA: hypothetical protein GX005_04200 [Bacteroidales bacterium]|nr:hypothetical protein [Bacteroidales bacterium]